MIYVEVKVCVCMVYICRYVLNNRKATINMHSGHIKREAVKVSYIIYVGKVDICIYMYTCHI